MPAAAMRGAPVAAFLVVFALAGAAPADENQDLNMIPGAVGQEQPSTAPTAAPASAAPGKLYVEDAAMVESLRSPLAVPLPPSNVPQMDWQNRTSLDATHRWKLGDDLAANVSDRINLYEENDAPIPAHQDFRNDFREGYVTWEPAPETYLEAGRINLHSGVALGFNPTDYFKTRTQVDLASQDPSVIREDRLGVAMVQAQRIFSGGSVSLVAAPKLQAPSAIPLGPPPSLDPGFGRTNGDNRFLASGSYDLGGDVSPELLLYHEKGATKLGADVSHTIGQAIVVYGEWSGGREASLVSRAIAFGHETGTLPAAVVDPQPGEHFANDAALGGSWTSGAAELTLNLEYHYHQSGFGRDDWHNWFALGNSGIPGVGSLLWYERAYAQDQQEPATRREFFLRADVSDAFVEHLELSAFAFVDAYDGSTQTQFAATYYLSDAWTVGALAGASLGASRSERGSLPEQASAIAQIVRYF